MQDEFCFRMDIVACRRCSHDLVLDDSSFIVASFNFLLNVFFLLFSFPFWLPLQVFLVSGGLFNILLNVFFLLFSFSFWLPL